MSWGAIASAAVSAGTSIYNANKQRKAAGKAAKASAPNPWGVQTPYGSVANQGGVLQFQQNTNPFHTMFGQIGMGSLANAATAPGSFLYGADPELAAAYQGLTSDQLTADAQDRYGLLSQLAQPEEQRQFNSLENRLFSRGQSGTTGGGIQQEAFYNAQKQADLQRQLAGQDWAASRAQNRFQGALQAVGSGQMGQRQQFEIGQQSGQGQLNMFAQLLNAGNQGISAGGGQNPAAAINAANQATSPWQAGYGALQQSGLIDKGIGALTDWWSNRNSGGYMPTTTPTGAPVAGGTPTNPYGLDFGPPKGGF